MKLVVTIDVEEDNWGEFIADGCTLENLKKIQGLQTIFDRFNVKLTYLINYPVATDKFSIEMFRIFLAEGKCEMEPTATPGIRRLLKKTLGGLTVCSATFR